MYDHDIIRLLRDYELDTGYTPTRLNWDNAGYRPCSRSIVRRFGSWNHAITQAGLDPNMPGWGRR